LVEPPFHLLVWLEPLRGGLQRVACVDLRRVSVAAQAANHGFGWGIVTQTWLPGGVRSAPYERVIQEELSCRKLDDEFPRVIRATSRSSQLLQQLEHNPFHRALLRLAPGGRRCFSERRECRNLEHSAASVTCFRCGACARVLCQSSGALVGKASLLAVRH